MKCTPDDHDTQGKTVWQSACFSPVIEYRHVDRDAELKGRSPCRCAPRDDELKACSPRRRAPRDDDLASLRTVLPW